MTTQTKSAPVLLRNLRENRCLAYGGKPNDKLSSQACDDKDAAQLWMREQNAYRNVKDETQCLDSYDRAGPTSAYTWRCKPDAPNQQWATSAQGTLVNQGRSLVLNSALDPVLVAEQKGITPARALWGTVPLPMIMWAEPSSWDLASPTVQQLRAAFVAYANANDAISRPMARRGPEKPYVIRIATFNVHYWTEVNGQKSNFDRMLEDIRAMDADILCLQEVTFDRSTFVRDLDTAQILQKLYAAGGYRTHHQCVAANFYSSRFGNLTLSRFPFVSAQSGSLGFSPAEDRCFIETTVRLPRSGELLTVLNIHLDVWDESEATRVKQVGTVLDRISKIKGMVVLTGDFNSTHPDDYGDWLKHKNMWQAFVASDRARFNNPNFVTPSSAQALLRSKLQHAFELYGSTMPPPATTWSGRAVDFFFLNPTVSITRIRTIQPFFTSSSDHIPLYLDLWNEP